MNVLDVLKERGLFEDVTSPDAEKLLGQEQCTVYAGFDPTSDSLQAGNFVTIMTLAHFQRAGHKVVALVGGATGMVGDPSGKSEERNLLSSEQIEKNVEGIRENLSRFLDFDHPTAPAVMVNNYDWFKNFTFIDFLRDVGKHFRLGSMLGKESVKARLNSDAGMSFTEFSYQLLQGYDFLHLYDTHGCRFQVGGSDQWGNITAGTDLMRKQRGAEGFGITTPLVCDSTGQKFGKSAGNAVFLDRNKTSCYDFYQFFVRSADDDVVRYLKIFTFLTIDEIAELENEVKSAPERRTAQKRLAEEVTRTVHGEAGLQIAMKASAVLFGESMEGLNADDLISIFADVPSADLKIADIDGDLVINVAADSGLCKSRGEARRLASSGGLYINNRRVESIDETISSDDVVDGRLVVLRSGKKRFHLVKCV